MKSKLFRRKYEASRGFILKKKRGQFAFLICIGLTAIVAFSMMDLPIASALWNETQYCDVEDCHENDEPTTWIQITETGQTEGKISYNVTGSNNYPGSEGWAVFDPLMNNIKNSEFAGSFTLPKSQWTYRVFWVDNETNGTKGSAYTDITTPGSAPHDLVIDGPSQGGEGDSLKFTFSSIDDENQTISYFIDWDDGSNTGWFGAYASGEEGEKSHSWSTRDKYSVRIKARDEYEAESAWESIEVEIPKNKAFIFNSFFIKFLEQHPFIFPILRIILGL